MPPVVTLAHDYGGVASVNTNTSSSTTFTLSNISANSITVNLTVTTCSGSLAPGSCTRSPTSTTLGVGGSATITVGFTGGTSAGSGTITLTAKNTSGTTLATSSVTVTVAAPVPTVSTAPHLGDRRDVGMCVADCFEATLAYSTPAYVSLDVPRSVTLLYRSGRAYPHGTLALDVSTTQASATRFRLKLKHPNGTYVAFSNGLTELHFVRNNSGPTRIVAQFPTTDSTSAAMYTAEVAMFFGTVEQGTAYTGVRILIINSQSSPFGAGVEIVGLQRVFNVTQARDTGVVVADGSGSASFFRGSCSPGTACNFTSPQGDFSRLSTTSTGYRRVYPDSTTFTFDATGRQLSTQDRFGTTAYVSWGTTATNVSVPSALTDPTGATTSLWYRDPSWTYGQYQNGSLGNIRLATGVDVPLGVNLTNDLTQWVETGGGTYRFRTTYDPQHRLTGVQLKNDSTWTYTYRYGATVDYSEAPRVAIDGGSTAKPRVTLRSAGDTLLVGAANGNGTSGTPLAVPTETRASITDALGNVTYLRLNRFGMADTVKAPLTNPAIAQYDSLTGQLKRTKSPLGGVVRYTWSAEKLTQTYDSTAGKTVNVEYETQYSLPKRIYGDVAEQLLTYDQTKAGWPLLTSKIGGSTATASTYAFDQYGRPTSITDPGGHTTTYGYQTSGLKNSLSVTGPNGQSNTVSRDSWGRVVSSTDRDGHTSTTSLDTLNRQRWVAGPQAGDTTRFQYNALNDVTVVTDAKNQVYTTQRNGLSWATVQIDPAGNPDSIWYDRGGNVAKVRTRAGRQVRFLYDSLNRLTKKIGLSAPDTIKYAYDPQSRWIVDSVVSGGILVSVDSVVTDSVGRVTFEGTNRPGVAAWSVQSAYQSNKPGRISSALYAGSSLNRAIQFSYDATQLPSEIGLPSGTTILGYDGDRLPNSVQFPSGLTETTSSTLSHVLSRREYNVQAVKDSLDRAYRTDSLGRLVERAKGNGTTYQTFDYINDRLTYWEKRHQTGIPTCTNLGGWGYDCSGTSTISDLFVSSFYDLVGNPNAGSVTLDPGNRLRAYSGVSMLYDADGNMIRRTAATTDSLIWDDFGQLKAVRQGATTIASFVYDGFGRRIRKITASGTVHYIWDGDQVTAEANGTGTIQQTYSYYPGIDQVHSVTSGGTTYYTSIEPATGDVNGLINGSTNALAATYAYTPWGEIESGTLALSGVNSLRWKGLIWDDETKLYYMRARYYDPKVRRFISEDPIGFGGGINLYAFGGEDPVNVNDPAGLDPCDYGHVRAWKEDWVTPPSAQCLWGDPPDGGRIDPRAVENTLRKIARRGGGQAATNGSQPPSCGAHPVLGALGKLWNSSNSALGLVWAGASYVAGKRAGTNPYFQIGNNAIQLINSPLNLNNRAVTLGNVQVYGVGERAGPSHAQGSYTGAFVNTGLHEEGHTIQGQILGPLYLPTWAVGWIFGGDSAGNPMEAGADSYALGESCTGF